MAISYEINIKNMKQEDKDLLIQDLCARLPYGVMIHLDDFPDSILTGITNDSAMLDDVTYGNIYDKPWNFEYIKPYLFPLSSMTEEQKREYLELLQIGPAKGIDYLNKHMFDYRGLIEKGLAIDCTNLNIY